MAEVTPTTSLWPRIINLAIGIWVFISAFVWQHTMGERTDTWILGVLIALAAIAAFYQPVFRYVNTILAIWLFISTLVIHHIAVATMWNNLIAAVIVFVLSLIPSLPMPHGTHQHPAPA